MAANNDTAFFKNEYERVKGAPRLHREDIEKHILELHEILAGMQKGLKIMEKMGRKPDQKVLDNHQSFQELMGLFQKLSI